MKLIVSAVTFSAAIVRSPSFSRSSSSTTMMILPARIAATASSMRANGLALLRAPLAISICCFIGGSRSVRPVSGFHRGQRQSSALHGGDHVFPYHVAFEVHAVALLRGFQICMLPGERQQHHVEAIRAKPRDRQTDAVDRNRSFED